MLAWRRSTLSLCAATLIISRLAIEDALPAFAVGGFAAVVLAVWMGAFALRRGRWSQPSLDEPEFEFLLRDGRLPAAMALVAAGLCGVVAVLALGLLP